MEPLEKEGYNIDIICRYSSSGNQKPREEIGSTTVYRIMNAQSSENKIIYFLQSILFILIAFFRLIMLSLNKKYSLIQVHNLPDY